MNLFRQSLHNLRFRYVGALIALSLLAVIIGVLAFALFWYPGHDASMGEAIGFIGMLCLGMAIMLMLILALLRMHRNRRMLGALERSFLELVSTAADMVIVASLDGVIVDINKRTEELLGYERQQLLDLTLWELEQERHLRGNDNWQQKLEWGETIVSECQLRSAGGYPVEVECRVRKAIWLDVPCYVLVAHDIRERKAAQAALEASKTAVEQARDVLENRMQERTQELQQHIEERDQAQRKADEMSALLSDMIDCMPSVIITVDALRQVRHWNQQAEQLTHISARQAVGKSLHSLLPQFDTQIDSVTASTARGRRQSVSRLHLRLHDRPYLFDVVVYPLSGRAKGVVIRIDDVTEKVRIEQTLVQSEKMLSLGGLAAGMAHEINNPLGAILQSAQNIERRLSADWPRNHEVAKRYDLDMDSLRDYLEKQRIPAFIHGIREAGERAAAIVSDMLSFARQNSSELQPVALAAALDAAVRLASANYNQKKKFDFRRITVFRDYDPDLARIRAQKNQLEQVFLNILINAAQALAMQPHADPQIHLRLFVQDNHAAIDITDNGPGMEEDVRRRVFEPFFTTKDESQGTGLGLSVSYFIITEQMRGTMDVDSVPGEGTTFKIRLPFGDKAESTVRATQPQIELPL